MAKKKRVYIPFVVDQNGAKYVDSAAIMSPLIPLIDGLSITTFKGDKKHYLKLDDAIKWVEEEMKHHSVDKYQKILTALNRFKSEENADDATN